MTELPEQHLQAFKTALDLAVNRGAYDAAIDALRPAIAANPAEPGVISLLTMIMVLRTLDLRANHLDKGLYALLQIADPVQAFVAAATIYTGGQSDHHYQAWRVTRLRKLLSLVGDDLAGKSILVPGDGFGNIGGFLASLGGNVTALEGREENRQLANLRYGKRFGLSYESRNADLNSGFGSANKFDLVVAFGVLEVLTDLDTFMESCAAVSDDVILETLVLDSTDAGFKQPHAMLDASKGNDGPLQESAVRASPALIERKFRDLGFTVERHFDRAINSPGHVYDWQHGQTEGQADYLRRFWRFQRAPKSP